MIKSLASKNKQTKQPKREMGKEQIDHSYKEKFNGS